MKKTLMFIAMFAVGAHALNACGLNWSHDLNGLNDVNDNIRVIYQINSPQSLIPIQIVIQSKDKEISVKCPTLESEVTKIDDLHYSVTLPDGGIEVLNDKNGRLRSSEWIGIKQGNRIELTSSCNWHIVYVDGRLSSIKQPDHVELKINSDCKAIRDKSDLNISFNKKSFSIKKLNENGIKIFEKANKEAIIQVFNGEIFANGRAGKYDIISKLITEDDGFYYSIVHLLDLNCLKSTSKQSHKFTIEGRASDGLTLVHKPEDSELADFCIKKIIKGRVLISDVGRLNMANVPVKSLKYRYNEDGKVCSILKSENGKMCQETIVDWDNLKISCIDAEKRRILYQADYNNEGFLIKYITSKSVYDFKCTGDEVAVIRDARFAQKISLNLFKSLTGGIPSFKNFDTAAKF